MSGREELISAFLKTGLPVLAQVVGLIGGPFGAVASVILRQIATRIGVTVDDHQALATQLNADPASVSTAKEVYEEHQEVILDALNQQQALNMSDTKSEHFFVYGWRPAMGWLAGPAVVVWQMVSLALHTQPIPPDMFSWIIGLWGLLAGIRTIDKWSSPPPLRNQVVTSKK